MTQTSAPVAQARLGHNRAPLLAPEERMRIVRAIVRSERLAATEKCILIGLVSDAAEDGLVEAPTEQLMLYASVKRKAVYAALSALSELIKGREGAPGLRVREGRSGFASQYQVTEALAEAVEKAIIERRSQTARSPQQGPQFRDPVSHQGPQKRDPDLGVWSQQGPQKGDAEASRADATQDRAYNESHGNMESSSKIANYEEGGDARERAAPPPPAAALPQQARLARLGITIDDLSIRHATFTISLGTVTYEAALRGLDYERYAFPKVLAMAEHWALTEAPPQRTIQATIARAFREEKNNQDEHRARVDKVAGAKKSVDQDARTRLLDAVARQRKELHQR